jgi:hypothetical protein
VARDGVKISVAGGERVQSAGIALAQARPPAGTVRGALAGRVVNVDFPDAILPHMAIAWRNDAMRWAAL